MLKWKRVIHFPHWATTYFLKVCKEVKYNMWKGKNGCYNKRKGLSDNATPTECVIQLMNSCTLCFKCHQWKWMLLRKFIMKINCKHFFFFFTMRIYLVNEYLLKITYLLLFIATGAPNNSPDHTEPKTICSRDKNVPSPRRTQQKNDKIRTTIIAPTQLPGNKAFPAAPPGDHHPRRSWSAPSASPPGTWGHASTEVPQQAPFMFRGCKWR